MILFLRHPKSDSWNFSWDRRRAQSEFEQRLERKQKESISNIKSEGFLQLRTLI